MAILHVRNIPQPLYERAKQIAAQRGKSLSALVIELLEELDRREHQRQRATLLMQQIRADMEARQQAWQSDAPRAADVIGECRQEREDELEHGLRA